MAYTGGSTADLISMAGYTEGYSQDFIYDANDNIEFIDHKKDGTVIGHTEMTYTGSNLNTSTYVDGPR